MPQLTLIKTHVATDAKEYPLQGYFRDGTLILRKGTIFINFGRPPGIPLTGNPEGLMLKAYDACDIPVERTSPRPGNKLNFNSLWIVDISGLEFILDIIYSVYAGGIDADGNAVPNLGV